MPMINAGSTATSRQSAIDANPTGTSFCLETGSHEALGSNTPKSGNTFTGQFGATIDGTGWASSDDTQAVFRAHNAAIIDVTIRNITIANVPQRAIHAYPWDDCTGWLVENCEIDGCGEGVVPGNNWIIRKNKIHDCHRVGHPDGLTGGAILQGAAYPNLLTGVLIEDNELYDFGAHQKLLDSTNCIWRRNHIHDAVGPGTWNDGYGDGTIVEYNIIERCGVGVMFELSFGGLIRYNTIRDTVDQSIYITTSRDTEVHHNTIEDGFRGIAFFVNHGSVGTGGGGSFPWGTDTRDNYAHHNTIRVPNVGGVLANFFSYAGTYSGGGADPYLNNTKQNNFDINAYTVPSLSGTYFLFGGPTMTFTSWQALPQDAGGSISL